MDDPVLRGSNAAASAPCGGCRAASCDHVRSGRITRRNGPAFGVPTTLAATVRSGECHAGRFVSSTSVQPGVRAALFRIRRSRGVRDASAAVRAERLCLLQRVQGPDRQDSTEAIRTARVLFYIAICAGLFACLDFLYQFPAVAPFGAQFLWLDSGVYRRAQGLFYEASTLGNFSAFFLVMSLVALMQPRARRVLHPALAAVGVVLFAAAMVLSFSRSSVVGTCAACVALAILEGKRWRAGRSLIILAALVLVAVCGLAYVLPEIASGYWQHFDLDLDSILQSPDRLLSGRVDAWRTVAGFIGDRPWQVLFSIGYKTLPNSEYLGRPIVADNMYLSTFVETGAAGLAALLAFNAAVLTVCWRAARAGTFYGKWMFCFWVGETVQMLSADILTYWRVLPLYFWVLAQAVRRMDLRAGTAARPIQ